MKHYAPFTKILEQLTTVLSTQQSGVFFIATDSNESARFNLSTGNITHCSFRRSHGQKALEELSQIDTAKCSFAENSRFPFRDKDCIEHEAALQTLGVTLPVTETPEDISAAETEAQTEVKTVTRMYRGKPVQIPLRPKNKDGQNIIKGQRIYRGKVIEVD
ncbi:MAG: Unknown protein [uncultured Thiotrichaceae bacterium]|uniref:Uncharacterized protein n=1 Tax=uncultured Thiotrichaceae bacterium TaxID=298394 RepID=A0A6S6TYZ2_9GAMM|nr:MAG: Unknown protein [uncultured Thiotrichaceae bacterium]